jgi:glutamate/tyrosine decarboxylase-like PLP-dependent enzyme
MLLRCHVRELDNAIGRKREALSSKTAEILRDAAARGIRYRATLDQRGVAPTPQAVANLAGFRTRFPDRGTAPERLLARLDELGSPATVTMAGGRYFGFVNGSSLPVTVATNWLATAWDQNCALYAMSPAAAVLEEVALEWVLEALRLPRTAAGAFVVGATMANFTALAAARHAVLARSGWDVDNDGLLGAPPVTVVVGEEVHATVRRALALLGLGRTRTLNVPVDDQGRLRPQDLPAVRGPVIVCIQAGNVNSGAIDAARPVCDWARRHGAWVHVDGAFGLWARALLRLNRLVDGYELADSWATDAHKWLNVPYDCGIAIVRDAAALRAAMAMTAAYLPPSGARDPIHWSPDGSRRARAVDVWAALAYLGKAGLAGLVDRCCRHAQRMARRLQDGGCRILNEVELNQVLVSFGDDATTDRVIEGVQKDGVCWCGGTRWRDQNAMRISVSSWATTEQDAEVSAQAILDARDRAVRGRAPV